MTPLKDCPGYFIDKTGVVYSAVIAGRWRTGIRALVPTPNADGYPSVRIYRNGVRVRRAIHRLMAETFLPNPAGHPVVRHLDDNKENLALSNLAWGTPQDNGADARRNGRTMRGRKISRDQSGFRNPNARLTPEQVSEIRRTFTPSDTFAEFARRYSVTYPTIIKIVRGITWKGSHVRPVLVETIEVIE